MRRGVGLFVMVLQTVLVSLSMVFPLLGYADSEKPVHPSLAGLFDFKGKNMKDVATQVAVLHEDSDIWGLDFSPDGTQLAATALIGSLKVNIWDWRNERIVRTLMKPTAFDATITEALRYSPDGHLLAACYGRSSKNDYVSIWNAVTGDILHHLDDLHYGLCQAIGFTPDGKAFLLAAFRIGNPGDNLIAYQTDTWQPAWGLSTAPFQPSTLAISPDGKLVAIGGLRAGIDIPPQRQILIVDLAQRAIVRTINAFPKDNDIQHLAWHPGSAHLAAGGVPQDSYTGPAVKIFDVRSGEQVGSEAATSFRINSLRYTPNGKYLIEANVAHTIRIWDGEHRELLQEIRGEAGSLAVSSDGRYLATGGDRKILVWELK
jgi:WD40 repeat protein